MENDLWIKILEYLTDSYSTQKPKRLNELFKQEAPNMSMWEIRQLLSNFMLGNGYIKRHASFIDIKKNETKTLDNYEIVASIDKTGHEYIMNMGNNKGGITVTGSSNVIITTGSNNVINQKNKVALEKELSEIVELLKSNNEECHTIALNALNLLQKENKIDFGLIGKLMEFCSNLGGTIEYAYPLSLKIIALIKATGYFSA